MLSIYIFSFNLSPKSPGLEQYNVATTKKMLKEVAKEHSECLTKALQKVELYLRKSECLDANINPIVFFSLFEYLDSDATGASVAAENAASALENEGVGSKSPSKAVPEEKSEADSEEEAKLALLLTQIKGSKLFKYIKEGRVDSHLVSIFRNTVSSSRHDKFFEKSDSEENESAEGEDQDEGVQVPKQSFGFITEADERDEIYDHLYQLYKSLNDDTTLANANKDIVSYIYAVWAPEVRFLLWFCDLLN